MQQGCKCLNNPPIDLGESSDSSCNQVYLVLVDTSTIYFAFELENPLAANDVCSRLAWHKHIDVQHLTLLCVEKLMAKGRMNSGI
jgi:hypothetical protein